jgi:energy-coupling factor transporter ATP-binding protein EcfA2
VKERINKGKSPFYPGQPVPVELFVGRGKESERVERAAGQVALGKQQAVFIAGEYGIGKSSFAKYMRVLLEKRYSLLGVHILLGTKNDLNGVAEKTVEGLAYTDCLKTNTKEKLLDFVSKYVGEQKLPYIGFTLHLEKLRADSPNIAAGYLPYLREVFERVKGDGFNGLVLIFDEINGISKNPEFARFIKDLVDNNALSDEPLPLLLMLCGVYERYLDLVTAHEPVNRLFEIVRIDRLSKSEVGEFFETAFSHVGVSIDDEGLSFMVSYSGGFPRLMHLIGDSTFWMDQDNKIDKNDAVVGILEAAEDVGRKFLNQQVYGALKSESYQNILKKIGRTELSLTLKKADIVKGLSDTEKQRFNNFIQRMKRLKVLKSGEEKGTYVFSDWLTRIYIMMQAKSG